MSVTVGHPMSHGVVDGIFQGSRSALDGHDFGSEQLHAEDVQCLAFDVDSAHVNDAVHTEQGRRRSGRDAVLTSPGFGDEACFSHPSGEHGLADDVVDLV